MPAIANIHSPDVRRWATSLQRRRPPGVRHRASHACLQRLAWAQALMARFSQSVMPTRRVEQRLRQRASTWMQRPHWFAPQVHVSWQALIVAMLQRLRSTFFVSLASGAAHRMTLLQTLVTREHQSHSTRALRTTVFRQSMADRLRTVTMHTTAATPLRGVATRDVSRSPLESFAASRQTVGITDVERSIVARVLRHHRRLEEQVAPSTRVLLHRSAPPASESAPMVAAPSPRPQPLGQNTGWSAAPSLQGLNITDITDQVVRQLDSRLIAARERFGHV